MKKNRLLDRKDYLIMVIIALVYGIISFYRLGSFSVPRTYHTFNNIGDEIVINLTKEDNISKIVYYTGNNIGDIMVMSSNDGNEYQYLTNIKTNSVFSWEESYLNTKTLSLKFIGNSNDVTLGDIVLYRGDGSVISVVSKNELTDESHLVPKNITFMNSMYFDEIYFARSAYEYVHGIDVFEWSHPPLGKLIMAIPVLLFGFSPFNVRLMGNIAGILLIPIMYILTKKIFKERKWALLGAIIMMFDTFHFAHTRIALVDGFQVLFILLSIIFMKNYLDMDKDDSFKKKIINLSLSGLFIGCAIATKWNALYVGLGLAITFFIHLAKQYDFHLIKYLRNNFNINIVINYLILCFIIPFSLYYFSFMLFNKDLARTLLIGYLILVGIYLLIKFIKWLMKDMYLLKLCITCIICFIMIPFIVYILSYLLFPNVSYYDGTFKGVFDAGKMMYDYHSGLVATHPFSSSWYQWPIMAKPVWLYNGTIISGMRMTIVEIGNPFVWWFGIISFIYLVISTIKKNSNSKFILIFILTSFVPYIFIGRIMFMYHYFITLPFIMLGIVAFIKWLSEKFSYKIYWTYICLVIIGFMFFYPVVSGTNISEDYINALKWFSSWYF